MNVEAKSPWLRMVNGYKNYYCYWLDKQLATRTPYSDKRPFGVAHHGESSCSMLCEARITLVLFVRAFLQGLLASQEKRPMAPP